MQDDNVIVPDSLFIPKLWMVRDDDPMIRDQKSVGRRPLFGTWSIFRLIFPSVTAIRYWTFFVVLPNVELELELYVYTVGMLSCAILSLGILGL